MFFGRELSWHVCGCMWPTVWPSFWLSPLLALDNTTLFINFIGVRVLQVLQRSRNPIEFLFFDSKLRQHTPDPLSISTANAPRTRLLKRQVELIWTHLRLPKSSQVIFIFQSCVYNHPRAISSFHLPGSQSRSLEEFLTPKCDEKVIFHYSKTDRQTHTAAIFVKCPCSFVLLILERRRERGGFQISSLQSYISTRRRKTPTWFFRNFLGRPSVSVFRVYDVGTAPHDGVGQYSQ